MGNLYLHDRAKNSTSSLSLDTVMKNFRVLIIYLLLIVGTSLFTSSAKAQNETGWRQLNEQAFKGFKYWYDSTTSMYQTRFPIIRNIPPLSSGMPFDIMFSYIVADSICRFAPQKDVTNLLNSWTSMNDTLRYAAKYLYRMMDYNPVIFRQYQDQIMLLRNMPFKTSFYSTKDEIQRKFAKFVPPQEKNAVTTVLGAEYILRVQVVKIDSMPDKLDAGTLRYRVTAKVLDTLKGRAYQSAPCNSGHAILDDASPYPCLYFQYTDDNYFEASGSIGLMAGDAEHEPWPYNVQDSAFMRARNQFAMKPGQDAIVFLYYDSQKFDHEYDYYDLLLAPMYSYNALPIINGQVRDVNKVWSNNLLMNYSDWKQRFEQIRNNILNASY